MKVLTSLRVQELVCIRLNGLFEFFSGDLMVNLLDVHVLHGNAILLRNICLNLFLFLHNLIIINQIIIGQINFAETIVICDKIGLSFWTTLLRK